MKINREEGSYTVETTIESKFKLRYSKKPKINPADKEKETVEILYTDIQDKEIVPLTAIINKKTTCHFQQTIDLETTKCGSFIIKIARG